MIQKELLSERQNLDKKIRELEKELSKLPTGNIYCVHDNNRIKWFHNDGHGAKYLTKDKQELITKLSNRKYLTLLLNNYLQERDAIDAYFDLHKEDLEAEAQNLMDQPAYQKIISTTFKPLSQELKEWMDEPYEKSSYHPEHLTYHTQSGNIVRSKSEAMIDMLLHMHNLPFRYESPLQLINSIIFPDFTIRHPKTGKIFYWEHFGMMDDSIYCDKALSKIQLYMSNGIMPGNQLIITFESKQVPFNPDTTSRLIEHYFLG